MTPEKHGPHNYPWSFVRFQCPRTSANTASGKQYYQYITNLILHILHNIMLHRLLKILQLFWILFREFFPQLLHLIQLLLIKTKRVTKYMLVIAFIAVAQKGVFLSGLSWAGRDLLCQLACWWYTWWHRSYSLYHVPCLCKWLSTLHCVFEEKCFYDEVQEGNSSCWDQTMDVNQHVEVKRHYGYRRNLMELQLLTAGNEEVDVTKCVRPLVLTLTVT